IASGSTYIPTVLGKVQVFGRPTESMWAVARSLDQTAEDLHAEVALYDASGRLVLEVKDFKGKSLRHRKTESSVPLTRWLYEPTWEECAPELEPARAEPGPWLIFSEGSSFDDEIVRHLEANGRSCIRVFPAAGSGGSETTAQPADPASFERVLGAVGR